MNQRSCLIVPLTTPRFVAKARTLPCDEVVLDLEDSSPTEAKSASRVAAVSALIDGGWGHRTVAVRINGTDTPWAYRDVIDVVDRVGDRLDSLVVPKVSTPEQISWLDILLTQIESAQGFPIGGIGIQAQIEDPRGALAAERIATASSRLRSLIFGPVDFSAALGTAHSDSPTLDHVRISLVLAARAAGIHAIDGPYTQIEDLDGLRSATQRAAALGFDGMWVVHPTHIDTVNDEFTPSEEKVAHARRIVAALDNAASDHNGPRGAVLLDGQMIDEATAKHARSLLDRIPD